MNNNDNTSSSSDDDTDDTDSTSSEDSPAKNESVQECSVRIKPPYVTLYANNGTGIQSTKIRNVWIIDDFKERYQRLKFVPASAQFRKIMDDKKMLLSKDFLGKIAVP